jgi:hypothetical protein
MQMGRGLSDSLHADPRDRFKSSSCLYMARSCASAVAARTFDRNEVRDRPPIDGNTHAFAGLEVTQDLSDSISQLALSDRLRHRVAD